MQILIINNKKLQTIITKSLLLNNIAINILDNNKSFSPIIFIKYLHSCKNKYIAKKMKIVS